MSSKNKKNQKTKFKKEQIHFSEKEKLDKYLLCPICQEIFDEPTRITCGHTFCKRCITQWEKKSHNYQCPLCRDYYEPEYTGKDLLAQNMINDAYVTCIYKGCPWKDKFSQLNNHIENCLFNPKKLPQFMKITNWFKEKEKEKDKDNENKINKNEGNEENEENNELSENFCSFNYTSSIKERVFSRNPNLVLKLFEQEKNKENIQEEKRKQNLEKISDNEEVNEIYNCLIFEKDEKKEKENKEKEKDKENKNENGQGARIHGSSIMNIFINPNITISPNNFLGNKTERDGK